MVYSAKTNLPAGLRLWARDGAAALYGTPTVTTTGQVVTIVAEGTTGRWAELAVMIEVVGVGSVKLPDNDDGQFKGVTYMRSPDHGGVRRPAAEGVAPITYLLTDQNGWPLWVCLIYDGNASRPGLSSTMPICLFADRLIATGHWRCV